VELEGSRNRRAKVRLSLELSAILRWSYPGAHSYVYAIMNHEKRWKILEETHINNRIGMFQVLGIAWGQEYLSFLAVDSKPNWKRPKFSGDFRHQRAILLAGFSSVGIQARAFPVPNSTSIWRAASHCSFQISQSLIGCPRPDAHTRLRLSSGKGYSMYLAVARATASP
jgi:hypothetical protein